MTGLFSKLNKRLPNRTVSSDSVSIARVIHNQPVPENATPDQLDRLVTQPMTPARHEAGLPSDSTGPAALDPWAALRPMLDDPTITDLFLSQPDVITYRKLGVYAATNVAITEAQYRAIVDDVECQLRMRCKETMNFLMGSITSPVAGRLSISHPSLNGTDWFGMHIRIPRISSTFYDLIRARMIPTALASWLTEALAARCVHVAVSGAPHSGKSTLAATLAHAAPSEERIIAIEPTPELFPPSRRLERLCQRTSLDPATSFAANTWGGIVEIALSSAPDRLILTNLVIPQLGTTLHSFSFTAATRALQAAVPTIFEFSSATAESVSAYLTHLPSALPIILIETQLHERKPLVRQVLELNSERGDIPLVLFHSLVDERRRWARCQAEHSSVHKLLLARGQELKLGSNLIEGFPENE